MSANCSDFTASVWPLSLFFHLCCPLFPGESECVAEGARILASQFYIGCTSSMYTQLSVFYLTALTLISGSRATANSSDHRIDSLHRVSRSLIFPATSPTRVQFIGGIGIPVEDLHFESVTSGYVLKTEYFLPTEAKEITHVYFNPQPITARKQKEQLTEEYHFGSVYRWVIYRGIEMVLQNMQLPGRSCLLRVICDHATQPLTHESGLLGELLHIVLTPSSSSDHYALHTDREYQTAERFGKRGGNCAASYGRKCPRSPIDIISLLL